MKLLATLTFFLFLMGSAFSQKMDQRLLERYSQTELETMMSSDRAEYDLLAYALDNGVYYAQAEEKKLAGLETIEISKGNLTYISLGLEILDQNQYFRINGDDRVLVVKSRWVLNHEMNK